ncbi:MAG: hypothetical protein HZB59_12715 [Ignavibacteriales bacterium]|nr:hypothetical protein [Ignavibacteriales bacterium]
MKASIILLILFLSLSVISFSQITHLGLDSICVNDIRIYNDYLYVGTVDSGVYRFNGADSSWSNLGLRGRWITSIYPDYSSLRAGVDRQKRPGDSTLIYRLSTGDWIADDSGIVKSEVGKVSMIDGNGYYLFAATDGGIYKKTDTSWQNVFPASTMANIKISPYSQLWISGMSGYGFYLIGKSNDWGQTWNGVSDDDTLFNGNVTSFAFHSKDTNIIYFANGNSIVKITDSRISPGNPLVGHRTLICDHNLSTVVIDPFDNNHLLAGGDHFQLYETTNAGDTWQLITAVDSGNNITDLEIRETNLCKVYISTSKNGVYQLTLPDAGYRMKLNFCGWNLFSLPLIPRDSYKPNLVPSAISKAFSFKGQYEMQDSLIPGKGYWVKYDGCKTEYFIGEQIFSLSIDVLPGWNMIGSISKPVAVANIGLSSGLTIGPVYTYTGGSYLHATTIDPGLGYWVRANQAGTITLVASP